MYPLLADQIVPMPDVLNPEAMTMDDKQLYVTEKANVYIFSLKDFKLIKKFGKQGAGPKEFFVNAQTQLHCDASSKDLLISSQLKVSFFSKNGEYIKEKRTSGFYTSFFRPIRDKFAGTRIIRDNNLTYFTVTYYDKNFMLGKELFRQLHFIQQGQKMNPIGRIPIYFIQNDRVFIADSSGTLHVFDYSGAKLKTISPQYKPLKLTPEHKSQILHFYKNDPNVKQFWSFFKDKLAFPEYFPNIRFATASDGIIYIQTWHVKNNKSEFLLFGVDGEFIKKTDVQLPDVSIMTQNLYAPHKGRIYQFNENMSEEQWELHIIDII